ncbi:hypothetical protein ABEB36_001259 [Hypothenemus hampei]|uniref:Glycoprotein-N-acetylgalactosamine 3-beta-galactosyltransferase 1 n=1 Tax=Hypothenemus hampei TaxID=57062 RepID=A0ABD1FDY7_HYPHA
MVNLKGKRSLYTFIAGFALGILFKVVLEWNSSSYEEALSNADFLLKSDILDYNSNRHTNNKMVNTTLSDHLSKKVPILCWIVTTPRNHQRKAFHVKTTWGRRCNTLLIFSSQNDPVLSTIVLPVYEGRKYLWGKTKEALKYIYKYYYDQYDWFFKADDDTYTVMENLRYLLYDKNSSEAIYFGCKLKMSGKLDYNSGGAGYTLSKEALRRFVEEALHDEDICRGGMIGDEDLELGKCLQAVGVAVGDTLDHQKRNRFTPLFINEMLIPGVLDKVEWFQRMMYNPDQMGFKCCSDSLITTHYVEPQQMYLLEYLIYHVTPFGRAYNPILPT